MNRNSLGAAAVMALWGVGLTPHEEGDVKRLTSESKPITQADQDHLRRAEEKRARKAAKLRKDHTHAD